VGRSAFSEKSSADYPGILAQTGALQHPTSQTNQPLDLNSLIATAHFAFRPLTREHEEIRIFDSRWPDGLALIQLGMQTRDSLLCPPINGEILYKDAGYKMCLAVSNRHRYRGNES
jgi:hypothetical protein